MVELIKNFIQAERTANRELHLQSLYEMLPFYHSSGHHNYAKRVQLYLQGMSDLKSFSSESEFDKFTSQGFFTIRRVDKFRSDLFTDLTIEQVLMKNIKVEGGLTPGRHVTDSNVARFLSTMVMLVDVT